VHRENRFYGHDRALVEAAFGSGARGPVRGQIQHGWSVGHGFGPAHRGSAWLPRLGWGERTGREARAAGLRHVTLIGAPFLYLPPAPAEQGPRPRATIAYPFHGTEKHGLHGSHDRLAAEIAERETGPVTVCLYFADQSPATVSAYERHGFTVISHGHRLDPGFLARQRAVLAAHDRVVTNRIGTAFWYGAVLGLEAEVYGPYFGLDSLGSVDARLERFQAETWPEFLAGPVGPDRARDVAGEELGAAHVRDPEELAAIIAPHRRRLRGVVEHGAATAELAARRAVGHLVGRVPALAHLDGLPLPAALDEDGPVRVG